MSLINIIKRVAAIPTLWLGTGTVFAGSACASLHGNLEILPATICLLFAIFAQLNANYYSAYIEMRNSARGEVNVYLADGKDKIDNYYVAIIKECSTTAFILSLTCGMALLTISKVWYWELGVGVLVYGIVALQRFGRKPLGRTPWGLLATFLLFGPVGVIGTSLIQSSKEAIGSIWSHYDLYPALFIAPAMGFLAVAVHLVFSYAGHRIEPRNKNFSIAAKLGLKGTQWCIFICGLFMLLLTVWMVMVVKLPVPLLAVIAPFIAFTLNTTVVFSLKNANAAKLRHLGKVSIANYALTGILLFVFFTWIASPDDSVMLIF